METHEPAGPAGPAGPAEKYWIMGWDTCEEICRGLQTLPNPRAVIDPPNHELETLLKELWEITAQDITGQAEERAWHRGAVAIYTTVLPQQEAVIKTLQEEITQLRGEGAGAKIDDLEKFLEKAMARIEELNEDRKQSTSDFWNMKYQQLKTGGELRDSYEKKIEFLQATISNQGKKIGELEGEKEQLLIYYQDLAADPHGMLKKQANRIVEYEAALQAKCVLITSLEAQLRDWENNWNKDNGAPDNTRAVLDRYKNLHTKSIEQITDLKHRLAVQASTIDELQEKNANLEKYIEDGAYTKATVDLLRKGLTDKEKELHEKQLALADCDADRLAYLQVLTLLWRDHRNMIGALQNEKGLPTQVMIDGLKAHYKMIREVLGQREKGASLMKLGDLVDELKKVRPFTEGVGKNVVEKMEEKATDKALYEVRGVQGWPDGVLGIFNTRTQMEGRGERKNTVNIVVDNIDLRDPQGPKGETLGTYGPVELFPSPGEKMLRVRLDAPAIDDRMACKQDAARDINRLEEWKANRPGMADKCKALQEQILKCSQMMDEIIGVG